MKTFLILFLSIFFVVSVNYGQTKKSKPPKIKFQRLKGMPTGKYGMGYCSDGKAIYSFGGGDWQFKSTNDFFVYYTNLNSWHKLPHGKEKLAKRLWTAAKFIPSLNRIFIFGGIDGNTTIEKLLPFGAIYKTDENRFEGKFLNEHKTAKPGSAVWEDKIYTFGGSISGKQDMAFSNKLMVYEPISGEWKDLANMPVAKECTGEIVDGKLYTFGGYKGKPQNEIHEYDIAENTWKKIGELPHNISANSIATDGKLIYLTGDYSNLKLFMIFNPATYETQTFHTNFNCRFAGAAVMENKLYVFGGLGMDMPHDYSNRLYYLDLSKLSL